MGMQSARRDKHMNCEETASSDDSVRFNGWLAKRGNVSVSGHVRTFVIRARDTRPPVSRGATSDTYIKK